MKKHLLTLALFSTTCLFANGDKIGVVNFATCIAESKLGKKEQENMESLRKQMNSLIEKNDKELTDLEAKLEDTEFVDGLSPKAHEELKIKHQSLQEDKVRYQSQLYQVLQHAQYQGFQKMHNEVAKVAASLANSPEIKLDYVLKEEACFYSRPALDLTDKVVKEMDKTFDLQAKNESAPQGAAAPTEAKQ